MLHGEQLEGRVGFGARDAIQASIRVSLRVLEAGPFPVSEERVRSKKLMKR